MNLSEGNKLFFFWVILISNLIFFTYWGWRMYEEFKGELIKKLSSVYIFCCLCGRKDNYEILKEERRKYEEHEILREDFLVALSSLKKKVDNEEIILD